MITHRSLSPRPPSSDTEDRMVHAGWYPAAKRALDLLGATVLLLVSAPLWALVALAIRLDSPGPVLLRQVRIGRGGRPFTCYKFRTMTNDCDDGPHRRYVTEYINNGTPSEQSDGRSQYKLGHDPRVTRVGRLLRTSSLDELPQLLNVLKGEMSLVGPRPPLPYEVEQYRPWHMLRLDGLPGITGLWQVYGRSRVTFDEMVQMDIAYLGQTSLLQDIRLVLLTVPVVLLGRGAR